MSPAFKLPSPETGTDYWIYVSAPDPDWEPGPWPVALFMDGDDQFTYGVKAYRECRAAGTVPPLLLVGVGYGASYGREPNQRGRDYTPASHPDEPSSGGADAFLQFLPRTLWPELGSRYPLHPKNRAIAGHSLGSLFVLHALFQPQPFFTGHLASAPSIWWDNRAILGYTERFRARHPALHAKLYLAVGGQDSDSMRDDLARLEAQLAAQPFAGLKLTSERFPKRDHYTALADAFPAGLKALFRSVPTSRA
jgi:predicted alpha/beta superfamily hydrolase